MADINWVPAIGTTYYSENTGVGVNLGTESNSYDENDSTYWGRGIQGYGTGSIHHIFRATFTQPISINRIKLVHAEAGFGNGGAGWWNWTLSAYYNGGWNTVGSGSGVNGGNHYNSPGTNDYTGLTLTNVTAVQHEGNAYGNTVIGPPNPPAVIWSTTNELYAYGPEDEGPSGNAMLFGADF